MAIWRLIAYFVYRDVSVIPVPDAETPIVHMNHRREMGKFVRPPILMEGLKKGFQSRNERASTPIDIPVAHPGPDGQQLY